MSTRMEPCPHVSPAMIAAGFTRCAMCGETPRPAAGFEREDTSRQEEAVRLARRILADALGDLADEAKKAAKVLGTKRGSPDMDRVRAAERWAQQSEQALDLAVYDLQTARGADG